MIFLIAFGNRSFYSNILYISNIMTNVKCKFPILSVDYIANMLTQCHNFKYSE